MFNKKHFSQFLRAERAKHKWSQSDLASKVGVSRDTVYTWEDEKSKTSPSLQTACVLADVLECDVSDLACSPQEAVA